jgi:hypothetical protein
MALQLAPRGEGGVHPLQVGDRPTPALGLRSWIAPHTATGTRSWLEAWVSVGERGAVTFATAIGGHRRSSDEHCRDTIVGGQTEAAAQAAVPAAEREPDNSDATAWTGDGDQSERLCRGEEVGSGRFRLNGGRARRGVERDAPHAGDVDDQAAVPNRTAAQS